MPFARVIICIALLFLGGGAFAEEAHNRVALSSAIPVIARARSRTPSTMRA